MFTVKLSVKISESMSPEAVGKEKFDVVEGCKYAATCLFERRLRFKSHRKRIL